MLPSLRMSSLSSTGYLIYLSTWYLSKILVTSPPFVLHLLPFVKPQHMQQGRGDRVCQIGPTTGPLERNSCLSSILLLHPEGLQHDYRAQSCTVFWLEIDFLFPMWTKGWMTHRSSVSSAEPEAAAALQLCLTAMQHTTTEMKWLRGIIRWCN